MDRETNISVKQSTPTTGQVLLHSPDQSRISMIGQRLRNDSTPTSRQRYVDFFGIKVGFLKSISKVELT